jgi:quinoprotein glucose dehydrogenase
MSLPAETGHEAAPAPARMSLAPGRGAPWVFASILLALGVVLGAGGAELVWHGGSPYYLVTGIVLIASAGFLWRGRRLGMWLYLLVVGYTLAWSLWEIGLDGWALASRMGLLVVLALYFLFPGRRRRLS